VANSLVFCPSSSATSVFLQVLREKRKRWLRDGRSAVAAGRRMVGPLATGRRMAGRRVLGARFGGLGDLGAALLARRRSPII